MRKLFVLALVALAVAASACHPSDKPSPLHTPRHPMAAGR